MSHVIYNNEGAIPGPQIEVARNLFTNPSFTAGAGTVEVWRNLAPNPALASTVSGWGTNGSSSGNTAQGRSQALLPTGAQWAYLMDNSEGWLATSFRIWQRITGLSVGSAYTFSLSTVGESVSGDWTIAVINDSDVNTILEMGEQITHDGTTKRPSVTWTATQPDVRIALMKTSPSGPGRLAVSLVLAMAGAISLPYFDGSFSPDPDLTPSWTGTPNASESVLTGVPVTGGGMPGGLQSLAGCLAIRSSKFGGSMRLIARHATDTFSGVQVLLPESVRARGTAMATAHLLAPITGTLHVSGAGALRVRDPEIRAVHDNAEGSYPMRVEFSGLSAGFDVQFMHRGLVGSGDVYWTMGGLFEGDYDGPWFDGDTADDPENDILYDWTGTPNASESVRKLQTWSIPPRTRPLAVEGYEAVRESRNVIHDLLDGSIGISYIPPRPRAGTLTTVYTDRQKAFEAYRMYASPNAFTAVSDVDEVGMTFAVNGKTTITQDDDNSDVWYVDIDYQEVS